jgi:hypothetical protein
MISRYQDSMPSEQSKTKGDDMESPYLNMPCAIDEEPFSLLTKSCNITLFSAIFSVYFSKWWSAPASALIYFKIISTYLYNTL